MVLSLFPFILSSVTKLLKKYIELWYNLLVLLDYNSKLNISLFISEHESWASVVLK